MDFTFNEYERLVKTIDKKGYEFCNYHDYLRTSKPCILRHDVDFELECAAEFAEFEKHIGDLLGVDIKSTYFVLLNTDFYNLYSSYSRKLLRRIRDAGQLVGLHFDETQYEINHDIGAINKYLQKEIDDLSDIMGERVDVVSMHRPSKFILESNIQFPNIINTYSSTFLKEFKYVSDSRMSWREDIFSIVGDEKYKAINILTHPIWYNERHERGAYIIDRFMDRVKARYELRLSHNIRDYYGFKEL